MALTPDQQSAELEVLRLEVRLQGVWNQLMVKCPELFTIYDLPENGERMAKWLESQNPPLPFTVENLVLAFNTNRHLFTQVETEDEKRAASNRAYRDKLERDAAARQARRIQEQDRQKPLTHISHRQLEEDRQAAETETQKAAKAMRERIERMRQNATDGPPTIYFPERTKDGRAHPFAGKVDWRQTYTERKRLGFDTDDGGKTNVKLKGE